MMLLLLLTMASSSALEPDVHMRDVTGTSGLVFTATCGTLPTSEILEANGGGMALLDFDRDGDLDLFIANGSTLNDPEHGPGSRLYENCSTDDTILFKDATSSSGIQITRWAMGAAAGDFDGDGHVDLYVTCHGPNVLLRNLGDGTFQDATRTADVAGNAWSTSAAFGDLDADGDLDLFVVNYLEFDPDQPPARSQYKGNPVMGGPHGLPPTPDVLYENLGNGTFRNATEHSGVGAASPAFGLNLAILDMNDDGLLDVFVGNDSMPNHLWLQRPGDEGIRLDEHGQRQGIAANMDGHDQATMGVAIADVNGDSRPDVFTTNFSSDTNTLHIAAPDGLWDDRTSTMGLGLASRRMLGWASAFADLDHDGDEDLLMVNGHVYPQATLETMDSEYMQPPVLMIRDGQRFTRSTAPSKWLTTPHRDRNLLLG
ncbi:MAG: VCBS repeat-containing protein, partial [Phycisphaerales bacterium]|nr:VCBS repeat-containing protein [Phycisphaerales bacterium]